MKCSIPEDVLRAAWGDRRIQIPLLTTCGKAVEVLEWGELNADAGPDVRDALIRIDGTLYRGDVELHVDARAWDSHGHARDEHYNGVILHVAFRSGFHTARTASGRIVPLAILTYSPDAYPPSGGSSGNAVALRCFERNSLVPHQVIHRWLHQLGRERLGQKVSRTEARLKELALEQRSSLREPTAASFHHTDEQFPPEPTFTRNDFTRTPLWDQLLYEGVMDCLGFGKNRKPMLRLARSLRLEFIRQFPLADSETVEALLLGAAGFLPAEIGGDDEETSLYLAALNQRWREIRSRWHAYRLHPAEWIFFRLRPANFPTARLAVMAALLPRLFSPPGFRRLLETARARSQNPQAAVRAFASLFAVKASAYWHHRCNFGPPAGEGGAVLGTHRIHDILINAVVPVLLTFACIFDDKRVRLGALKLYAGMGLLQNNTVLERMKREVVKGRMQINGAASQQALLQLHNAYCTKGRCGECALGQQSSPEPTVDSRQQSRQYDTDGCSSSVG